MTTQELMDEAKQRYPIGTVFVPAHVNTTEQHEVIGYDEQSQNSPTCIVVKSKIIKEGGFWTAVVFYGTTWARIISKPKTEDYPIF